MTWLQTFAVLCACHALADYPLQGDWLSKAKNHRLNLVPGEMIWPLALASHAAIHALMVWIVTGYPALAFVQFSTHALIDFMKCDGKISYNQDQALHIAVMAIIATGYVMKGSP